MNRLLTGFALLVFAGCNGSTTGDSGTADVAQDVAVDTNTVDGGQSDGTTMDTGSMVDTGGAPDVGDTGSTFDTGGTPDAGDTGATVDAIADTATDTGSSLDAPGDGNASFACGALTCDGTQICVARRTVGGACMVSEDGGCPVGRSLVGSCCEPDPTYTCEARPAGCSPLTCSCAAPPICTTGAVCSTSGNQINCTLELP